MSKIIAGYFQTQDEVSHATTLLVDERIPAENISAFFVNPAGQHDRFYLGGDHDKSPGAKESGEGLAVGMVGGGAVGAAIGMAGFAVAGPLAPAVGALLGAHTGGLVGTMSSMKERGVPEDAVDGAANASLQRKSGMLLAVAVSDAPEQARVLSLLEEAGAYQLEQAQGTIIGGDWIDFDPTVPPVLVQRDCAVPTAPS